MPILEVTEPVLELFDHDLILVGIPPVKRLPRLINEIRQWDPNVRLADGHELGLQGVQLGLHGGRQNVQHADVLGLVVVGELVAQGLAEVVQGGLGSAVVAAAGEGDEGQAGGYEDDGSGCGSKGNEMGEKGGDG